MVRVQGEAWAEDTVRQRQPEGLGWSGKLQCSAVGLGAVLRGRRGQACVCHPWDGMGCALQPHLWPCIQSRI